MGPCPSPQQELKASVLSLSDVGLLCCHRPPRILSHPAKRQLVRKPPPPAILAQGPAAHHVCPVSTSILRVSIVGQGTGEGQAAQPAQGWMSGLRPAGCPVKAPSVTSGQAVTRGLTRSRPRPGPGAISISVPGMPPVLLRDTTQPHPKDNLEARGRPAARKARAKPR